MIGRCLRTACDGFDYVEPFIHAPARHPTPMIVGGYLSEGYVCASGTKTRDAHAASSVTPLHLNGSLGGPPSGGRLCQEGIGDTYQVMQSKKYCLEMLGNGGICGVASVDKRRSSDPEQRRQEFDMRSICYW
jgi:hypothetical protein